MPDLKEVVAKANKIGQFEDHASTRPGNEFERRAGTAIAVASPDSMAGWRDASFAALSSGYVAQLIKVTIPLLLSDLMALSVSLFMAYGLVVSFGKPINHFLPFLTIHLTAVTVSLWLAGCYPAVGIPPAKELRKIFRGCLAACFALVIGLMAINNSITPYMQVVLIGFPMAAFLIPFARCLTKDWMQAKGIFIPFYFVGDRADVVHAYQEWSRFSWTMLSPVGRFRLSNDRPQEPTAALDYQWESRMEADFPGLGTLSDLCNQSSQDQVYWLFIVGDPNDSGLQRYRKRLEKIFPQVVWVARPYSTTRLATGLLNCGLAVGLRSEKSQLFLGPRIQKRIIDVLVSSTLLLMTLPLLMAIAVGIKLTSRGPVLLRNPRVGPGGQVFHAWKFRSMVDNADDVLQRYLDANPSLKAEWDRDQKLKQDPRVTAIGRVIRKTSLDELPQLWNVLIGQMSLVGPRPILIEEVAKYGDTYDVYLTMRPGITGLWQVSGRNNTSYPERLTMVRYYVQNWSVWLDLHILLRTIRTVLLCEGSY